MVKQNSRISIDIPSAWADLDMRETSGNELPKGENQEMQNKMGADGMPVRISMHLGDLELPLSDYIDLREGSELVFPANRVSTVTYLLGSLPIGSGVCEIKEGEMICTVRRIFSEKMRGS